jgi:hypothetical protein
MSEYGRLICSAVEFERVLLVEVYTRRKHHALLSGTRENMPTLALTAIKPVGVVERAAAQP